MLALAGPLYTKWGAHRKESRNEREREGGGEGGREGGKRMRNETHMEAIECAEHGKEELECDSCHPP